jgi:hypothetical protein
MFRGSSKTKLAPTVHKQLLQDIEALNLPLDQVDLHKIVTNKSSSGFGEPNTDQRVAISKRFINLKKRRIDQYLKILDKLCVEPSPTTLRFVRQSESQDKERQQQQQQQQDLQEQVEEEPEEPESEPEPDDKENPQEPDLAIPTLTDTLSNMSQRSDYDNDDDNLFGGGLTSPPRITLKKTLPSSPPPARIHNGVVSSPAPSISMGGFITSSSTKKELLQMFLYAQGSEEWPCIVSANTDFPERNNINFVPNIHHKDVTRAGFHIKTSIPELDEDLWEATIPGNEQFSFLWGSCMLIQGPSGDAWIRDVEAHHTPAPLIDCPATKTAHEQTHTVIAASSDRAQSFWLIVFSVGTQLDNYIFSEDHDFIEDHTVAMFIVKDATTSIHGMAM